MRVRALMAFTGILVLIGVALAPGWLRKTADAELPVSDHPFPKERVPSSGRSLSRAEASLAPGEGEASFGQGGTGGAQDVPVASTNWYPRLMDEIRDQPPLPPEVIEQWLASGHTNAPGLLALRQAGEGDAYLHLALAQFPHDPRVLMAAVGLHDDPQARRARLDRFQAAAPENALADYLSAQDHFAQGRPEAALADLQAASQKATFNDYVLEAMLNTEELYLQAGRSAADAKMLGTSSAHLSHLAKLKNLGVEIADLQARYLAAGDPGSAEMLAQHGVLLGERLAAGAGSDTLISQLVGVAIERIVLKELETDRPYDFLGGTVLERQALLDERKAATRRDAEVFERWIHTATESEAVSYFDRFKVHGEAAAMEWVRQRSGSP